MSLLSYMILSMLNIQAEIAALQSDIRRTVAKVLRTSRWYTDDHVEECTQDVIAKAMSYGVRTFDENRGSLKSHFTMFARNHAINWLTVAHRRFESAPLVTDTDDEGSAFEPRDDNNPFALLVRKQEAQRIRAAIASLQPRYRALIDAFFRTSCWYKAGQEIGVSATTAHRMKMRIVERLR